MHDIPAIDSGRSIDWGRTSADYAAHRPGPPASFFRRLEALGVGLPGQHILDLGTGTGVLARQFARQGVQAAGIDIAAGQIEAARALAEREGVSARFEVAPAEQAPFPDASFDAITALQAIRGPAEELHIGVRQRGLAAGLGILGVRFRHALVNDLVLPVLVIVVFVLLVHVVRRIANHNRNGSAALALDALGILLRHESK